MNWEEDTTVRDLVGRESHFARKIIKECVAPEVWKRTGTELGDQIWEQVHRNVASFVQSKIADELGISGF